MLKFEGAITFHAGGRSHHSQEECIPEHVLCHIIDGELKMQDTENEKTYVKGDTLLIRKDYLVKCEKRPLHTGGRYQLIFIVLDHELLQNYLLALDKRPILHDNTNHPSVIVVQPKPALQGLLESLRIYHANNYQPGPVLLRNKLNETLAALMEQDPYYVEWLFQPEKYIKLDLVVFMERNFRFNIPMKKFAELSGRSLSTFQRDFKREFGMKASTWLLKRRLQAASQLLKEHKKPSDIYLSLGFEDLSHFSRSYKQEFKVSPSKISSS